MSRYTDKSFEDKYLTILNEDEEELFKAWNQGIGIKLLIIMPSLLFLVGFFIVNTPQNPFELLSILLFPFMFILLGVFLFFIMVT